MPDISVESVEELRSLASSIQTAGGRFQEELPRIGHSAERAKATLERRLSECRSKEALYSRLIAGADEDDDTSGLESSRQIWEDRARVARSCLERVVQSIDDLQRYLNRLQTLSSEHTARCKSFLCGRADELDEYVALSVGGRDERGGFAEASGIARPQNQPVGYGYVRRPHDSRDWLWGDLYRPPDGPLPKRRNLESIYGGALDQGQTPHCVAYSVAALARRDCWMESKAWKTFNPGPIYASCKNRDGAPHDEGTTIRDALKVACNGLTSVEGGQYIAKGYARLSSLFEMKHALSLGKSVLIGVKVKPTDGNVQDGCVTDLIDPEGGGHCMVVTGYDDDLGVLRIRNSWSSNWADFGHCLIPYVALLNDPEWEAWTTVNEKVEVTDPSASNIDPAGEGQEFGPGPLCWIEAEDVDLALDDCENLTWRSFSQATAKSLLSAVSSMRPYIDLDELARTSASNVAIKLRAVQAPDGSPRFSDEEVQFFMASFGTDAIRIDVGADEKLTVINGRHRLFAAKSSGIKVIPASLSIFAKKVLKARHTGSR